MISFKFILYILSLLVCSVSIIAINCTKPQLEVSSSPVDIVNVMIGDQIIIAEVASSPEQRSVGLSGKEYLKNGRGMLFYYANNRPSGFWMKGMLFGLDILWIGEDCRIIGVIENVSPPESVLSTELEIYIAPKAAIGVLEIGAGQTKALGINIGAKVAYQDERSKHHYGCSE